MAALFKKLSPDAARLQTLFHRHARGASFASEGKTWRFGPAVSGGGHSLAVYGKLGDGEFVVWLDEPDWRLAVASVLAVSPDAIPDLPELLRRAALECFASGCLAALEKAVGLPASLTRLEEGAVTPLASACSFRLVDDAGLTLGGAWIVVGAGKGWRLALEKALLARPVPRASLPDDLPLSGLVGIGAWSASVEETMRLAVGDVALSPAGPERFLMVGGRLRFAARLERGILTVEGKTMTTDASPAPQAASQAVPQAAPKANPVKAVSAGGSGEAAQAAGQPERLERVDAVEVELLAQVGRLTLTLAELRQLGTGQVVEFSTPVESPATLVVGGRPVARGELVDVCGRVGVRITSMLE
ncbi:MAG: type III secretion system cytoplasmic ring protein SctQ [Planctomycetota bacterium]|jgi:type III secretion system YscQ/HrcQ family protein|nr:type III secretion system cytoplasmic ring protein SctQ [Planctomycetota bacterium]